MGDYIQVFMAAGSKRDAKKIADALLEGRLAGCVQIMPVESFYRWKGRIERDREYLCIIKSSKALYKKIEDTIKSKHPYEVPEIIACEVASGAKDYLSWLEKETCLNKEQV